MKTSLAIGCAALCLALAACATPLSNLPTREPSARPTPAPTLQSTATSEATTSDVLPVPVMDALARPLAASPDALEILWFQKVEWLNACLGPPVQDDACAPVLTPGFGGMLEANGQQYEFRSDETGQVVQLIPGAVLAARQFLAQQIHFTHPDGILITHSEPVEWPDGCLGVHVKGADCTPDAVPGYRVTFEANGDGYEFHTDQDGGQVILVAAPELDADAALITWTLQTRDSCQTALIGDPTVAFGACGGPLMTRGRLLVEMDRPGELAYFVQTYAAFEAETSAGVVSFHGAGGTVATEAEQRMIAEWARLVAQEAYAGRSGASWGLAMGWRREGGASACEGVNVYMTGVYFVSSCRDGQSRDLGHGRLNADQLEQLYACIDSLKNFEFTQKEESASNPATTSIVFAGAGAADATEADRQAIQDFGAQLFAHFDG